MVFYLMWRERLSFSSHLKAGRPHEVLKNPASTRNPVGPGNSRPAWYTEINVTGSLGFPAVNLLMG